MILPEPDQQKVVTPDDVYRAALKELTHKTRVNMDPWKDTILLLRSKNWTLFQIHAFLINQGANVHKKRSVFASTASKAIKRWQRKEGNKS